ALQRGDHRAVRAAESSGDYNCAGDARARYCSACPARAICPRWITRQRHAHRAADARRQGHSGRSRPGSAASIGRAPAAIWIEREEPMSTLIPPVSDDTRAIQAKAQAATNGTAPVETLDQIAELRIGGISLQETLAIALGSLTANKLRTLLTALGVIIGVG